MEVTLEGDYFDGFFQIWSIGLKNDKHNFSIFLSLEQRNTSKEYDDEFEPFLQLSTMFQHSGLEFKQNISIIEGDEDHQQNKFLNKYHDIIVKPYSLEDLGYKTPNYLIIKEDINRNYITIESGDYVFEIDCESNDGSKKEMIQELEEIIKSNKNGVELLDEHPGDKYWE